MKHLFPICHWFVRFKRKLAIRVDTYLVYLILENRCYNR